MYRMATDPKFHDVHFIVGSGTNIRKIGCNRTLLSVHCPVFEAMFESAMLESSENVVKIPDIDPVVFMSMLQWMSTNTLNIASICSLDDLIKLADRYQIGGLLSSCCLFLRSFTMTIHVVTDSILVQFHGVDLGLQNLKEMTIRLRILAYSSISDVIRAIGKQLHWTPHNGESIELWRVSNRKNGTTRPNRYLSPLMDDDSFQRSHRRKREMLKQEMLNGNGSGLALDDDLEDDLDDDDDDDDGHHHHGVGRMDRDDVDADDEDAAMELMDDNGSENGTGSRSVNNVARASRMRCHECHKQQYDRKRSKSNKKMDWNQYSGDNPTKAIYARFCRHKNAANRFQFGFSPNLGANHNVNGNPNGSNGGANGLSPSNDSVHGAESVDNIGNVGDNEHDQKSNVNVPELAQSPMAQNQMGSMGVSPVNGGSHNAMEMGVDRDAVGNGKNFRNEILLFLKYYDVYHEYLSIVGSILVDKHGPVSLICDAIRSMARWGEEHEIVLWEEEDHKTNKVNPIEIGQSMADSSLVDGDIIVFQEKSNIFSSLQLKDAKTFLAQHYEATSASTSSPRHGQRGRRGMGSGLGGGGGNNGGGGGGGGGQHPGNGGMRGMAPMVDDNDF